LLQDVATNTSWQANPSVATSGNVALVAYEDGFGTTTGSANISARTFNSVTNALGTQFTIADHAGRLYEPSVATLSGTRYIVTYTDHTDVWGRIYDPATPGGAFLSDEFRIDQAGGFVTHASVTGTVDGGFIATWSERGAGGVYDIHAHRFDAHGVAYGDEFTVNASTPNTQYNSTVTTSGSNVLFAWEDYASHTTDASPSGIRAQSFTAAVFDYNNAGFGDFNNDGKVDFLFQNDTGNVMVQQTDSRGLATISTSLGARPAGYLIDGTGDFNSTPGDDILIRSGDGTLAVWPTHGVAVSAPVVLGTTSASYHNAGIGDFTGDGQDDLLFRGDGGEIATWVIRDNALATAPSVLGTVAAEYHIVGIDDFTGDHQSDILFRRDSGEIALWQVADNRLGSASTIGTTASVWHVVGTGDFDGNGANDVLFRHDNGELAEWLLDSSGALLMAPTSLGSMPASWHVEGAGDINGDGRDDIIFRDAVGTLADWLMDGTSHAPTALLGAADVDYAVANHHFQLV
jgi:hypothetical protein